MLNKLLKEIEKALEKDRVINLSGAEGSFPQFIVQSIWKKMRRPLIFVCSDSKEIDRLEEDITFYAENGDRENIYQFPSVGAMPYTPLVSQSDLWIDRLNALFAAEDKAAPLIITSLEGLLRRVPPRNIFRRHVFHLGVGSRISKEEIIEGLIAGGYASSPLVEDRGEFAARGYIIDFWSPVYSRPIRLELDDDKIASLRHFDPATQRTSFSATGSVVIPVRDVFVHDEDFESGLGNLKRRCDDIGISRVERRQFTESLKAGIYPSYTETFLPLLHPEETYLWDYFKSKPVTVLLNSPELRKAYQKFWTSLNDAYCSAEHIERAVRPNELYVDVDKWENKLSQGSLLSVNDLELVSGKSLTIDVKTSKGESPSGVWIEGSSESSLNRFIRGLEKWRKRGGKVIVVCHTSVQAERISDLLRWQGVTLDESNLKFSELIGREGVRVSVTEGSLNKGFVWDANNLVVLTESEIFGKRRKKVLNRPSIPTESFASYRELSEGDYLVHLKHGIGKYCGMTQMEYGGMKNDFLQIEYLGEDKLYVPAYRLNQIQRYVGPGEKTPFLDKMGGKRWERARLKANRAVRRMAGELLKLYAARKAKPGFSFSGRDHLMEEFEAAFPYDETPDQMQAIDDVLNDMQEPHPADRLICGDVGYGKTEVAMRAVFRAAMDGKQTAILVPTTILAFQHYETFKDRFRKTPITIELLNRFRTKKQQSTVIDGLRDGKVDVVIGTHRLLQKDIIYADLGLLVVDEEHRFGVKQKEGIKQFKSVIDVISMSATPIPRTLHISLVGTRDISVINTPPADRHAIRTYVAEFDEGLIRGAILKEIRRGGQIFFVHNRIETIDSMRRRLKAIIPEAKIRVGHGQMKEHQLEKVMIAFLKKEFDILLSTTIIESGLDIGNANTIIINRADTMGLAQLYQLRGRVGRSSQQAYSYLLIPEKVSITPIASKRLAALQRHTELGAGFQIAMHDLEIRGSGNILGAEQSGHISAIGYELYTELLEKEVRKLRGELREAEIDTEIQLPVEAYFPSDYIIDDGLRISFYKRISSLDNIVQLDEIAKELNDRFGKMPDVVKNLLNIIDLKIKASRIGLRSIQCGLRQCIYTFDEATKIPPQSLLEFVRKNSKRVKLKPTSTLIMKEEKDISKEGYFGVIRQHLEELARLGNVFLR